MKLRQHARMTRPDPTPYRGPADPSASSPDPIADRDCPRPLTPAGSGNLTLTALSYTADAWGRGWYATATPSLLNAGSRTAAGLYHHTTQTNQAKEASTQVDIGFHSVAYDPTSGTPADKDYDGLPNYLEDLDGNGAVNAGETDPKNLDSLSDGLPDAVRNAPPPSTYVSHYLLDATRDFTQIGRSAECPDAFVMMGWHHNQPSRSFKWGDVRELYVGQTPPPSTILAEGDEWNWPSVGVGARRHFQTTQAAPNTQVWGPSVPSDRPPSPEVLVLEEHCDVSVLNLNPMGGSYTRSARSWTSLKTEVHHWPKSTRSVVLEVIADQVDAVAELSPWAWNAGYNLPEPYAAQGGVQIDPVVSEILVRGRRVNPDGQVLLQVPCQPDSDVTPQVTPPPSWMKYVLSAGPAKPITMTWSLHPDAGDPPVPGLQALFDEGARILGQDDDLNLGCGLDDDVPMYLEFFIIPARHAQFPAGLHDPKYNEITSPFDLDVLVMGLNLGAGGKEFANIKLVSRLYIGGIELAGWAGRSAADRSNRWVWPSIVLVKTKLSSLLTIHEYGHLVHPEGLDHRGLENGNNPGEFNDTTAVMHHSMCDPAQGHGVEINAYYERPWFQSYTPAVWNAYNP